jgi:hypothetical protein
MPFQIVATARTVATAEHSLGLKWSSQHSWIWRCDNYSKEAITPDAAGLFATTVCCRTR